MRTPYPATWPKPNTKKPKSVVTTITEEQKLALYNREITTKDLANLLKVGSTYLSALFPGKITSITANTPKKRELLAIRKEYRALQAKRVLAGALTIQMAADELRISYRSMARAVERIRPAPKPLQIRSIPLPKDLEVRGTQHE